MKKFAEKIKKGFTIVELVIVIAVIGILAGVLIPTFSNAIQKAQISADTQLCRNLNTILANAEAQGRVPGSVYDVLYLENEGGYILENLNPTSEGFYFAWDQESNKIVYIMNDLTTVYYPSEYELTPGKCWITVGSADEAAKVARYGYNLALEKDITQEIVLDNVVSINTLGFTCGNLKMTSGSKDVATCNLIGEFGKTEIEAQATNIVSSGSVTNLSVSGNAATSVTVTGYVSNFSTSSSVNSVVSGTGLVNTVTSTNAGTITNQGVVQNNSGSTTVTGNNATAGNTIAAGTKEDLDSIRTQVGAGVRTFKGETVELSNDINLNGIAFTPVSNFSRESADQSKLFSGTFDGKNYSINNFSTQGFSITGLNAGTNDSTPYFGNAKILYNEAVYGLFACVKDATFKNLVVTCSIDMVLDNANHYVGDSVGGIVGCAFGEVTFENCTVNGYVKGYDGVGGFLGRLKGTKATFINCTNNADITGVRKTGGFIGSSYTGTAASGYEVVYNNCENTGDITCLGIEQDIALGAWDKTKKITGTPAADNLKGYYTASASNGEYLSYDYVKGTAGFNTITKIGTDAFKNTGVVKVGSLDVGNGTYVTYESGSAVNTYTGKAN